MSQTSCETVAQGDLEPYKKINGIKGEVKDYIYLEKVKAVTGATISASMRKQYKGFFQVYNLWVNCKDNIEVRRKKFATERKM